MTAWNSPQPHPVPPAAAVPPHVPAEPEAPRSRLGLWLQMCFQPLWLVPNLALGLVQGALEEIGILRGPGYDWSEHVLGTPRWGLERGGSPEGWEEWLEQRLTRSARARVVEERRRRAKNLSGRRWRRFPERVPVFVLQRRYYRGIGPRGAAAVAWRHGWAVDWEKSPDPYRKLTLRYQGPLDREPSTGP